MIQYACISVQGLYHQSCSSATSAFIKQTGIERNVGALESYGKTKALNVVTKVTGKKTIEIVGSAYYVYHVAQTKTLSLRLPNFGIASSINTTLTNNSVALAFSWSIR